MQISKIKTTTKKYLKPALKYIIQNNGKVEIYRQQITPEQYFTIRLEVSVTCTPINQIIRIIFILKLYPIPETILLRANLKSAP